MKGTSTILVLNIDLNPFFQKGSSSKVVATLDKWLPSIRISMHPSSQQKCFNRQTSPNLLPVDLLEKLRLTDAQDWINRLQ